MDYSGPTPFTEPGGWSHLSHSKPEGNSEDLERLAALTTEEWFFSVQGSTGACCTQRWRRQNQAHEWNDNI